MQLLGNEIAAIWCRWCVFSSLSSCTSTVVIMVGNSFPCKRQFLTLRPHVVLSRNAVYIHLVLKGYSSKNTSKVYIKDHTDFCRLPKCLRLTIFTLEFAICVWMFSKFRMRRGIISGVSSYWHLLYCSIIRITQQ